MFRDVGQARRTEMERDDESPAARSNSLVLAAFFWTLLSLSQIMKWFVIVPLSIIWVVQDIKSNGLEVPWTGSDKTFNWHPLLATIGYIVIAGDGTLVFRGLSRMGVASKTALKVIHVGVMSAALGCIGLSLAAIFKHFETRGHPHLHSFHSKLGLACSVQFATQYLVGLVFYAFPWMPANGRRMFMPFHRFFGKALLVMSSMVLLTGMMEKLGQEAAAGLTYHSSGNQTGIALGFLSVYCVAIMLFMLGRDEYRRYHSPNAGDSPSYPSGSKGDGKGDGSEMALLPQN